MPCLCNVMYTKRCPDAIKNYCSLLVYGLVLAQVSRFQITGEYGNLLFLIYSYY